jgi:hypothetical protein
LGAFGIQFTNFVSGSGSIADQFSYATCGFAGTGISQYSIRETIGKITKKNAK